MTKYTKEELSSMARSSQPGQANDLTTRETDEYLALRQQNGWPNSRSIHGRLLNKHKSS